MKPAQDQSLYASERIIKISVQLAEISSNIQKNKPTKNLSNSVEDIMPF